MCLSAALQSLSGSAVLLAADQPWLDLTAAPAFEGGNVGSALLVSNVEEGANVGWRQEGAGVGALALLPGQQLESLADGLNAAFFKPALTDESRLLVPAACSPDSHFATPPAVSSHLPGGEIASPAT